MASASTRTSSESERTRLERRIARAEQQGRPLLIPYLTAGFPTPSETPQLMAAIAEAGGDILELGVPFSDPLADGPTIQGSSQTALDQGESLSGTLEALREFRHQDAETPVIIFTYLNPVFRHGVEAFVHEAVAAGADGVLLTDLPLGADPALERRFEESSLALVRLIAPTTTAERARAIAARAQGFLYYISRTGVTGARQDVRVELEAEVAALKQTAAVPVAVGFGISSPEQAAAVADIADGVVVGSALIERIREGGVEAARSFIADLRAAV